MIDSLSFKTREEAEVGPEIEFIVLIFLLYCSNNSTLYLKFLSLSKALPKCTKFEKL